MKCFSVANKATGGTVGLDPLEVLQVVGLTPMQESIAILLLCLLQSTSIVLFSGARGQPGYRTQG